MMQSTRHGDHALTAVSNDGAFRVIVVRATETARGVIAAQKAAGRTAENLAELVTGTLLVRLTMAPAYRVQGIVRGADQKSLLVADAYPDGATRGLVRSTGGAVEFGEGALLQMQRSMPNGAPHQGVVQVGRDRFEIELAPEAELEVRTPNLAVASVGDGVELEGKLVQENQLLASSIKVTLANPLTPPQKGKRRPAAAP